MNVKKVGNVILAVRDLNKSLEFYNKILGMPIKNQRENWVDLGQSGALLSLHPADESSPHIGTSVDNGVLIGLLLETGSLLKTLMGYLHGFAKL